jgi:hypothetical protein
VHEEWCMRDNNRLLNRVREWILDCESEVSVVMDMDRRLDTRLKA